MSTPHPQILGAHQFLRGLPDEQVAWLAARARSVQLPARQRLFEEGGNADRCWLIQAGQIALDTVVPGRGRVVIESLGRGDVIGLSWLFPPYRWGFGAITTQAVQAFELDAAAIRAECARDPAFGYELTGRFLSVTLHRLQITRSRLLDLTSHPDLLP
jgi:CRP/FNR family transcriptional regulator, cyclic AMP receptor protein